MAIDTTATTAKDTPQPPPDNTAFQGEDAPWKSMNKLFSERSAAVHAAHLLPHLQPTFHILDVGCGLGSISTDLAALVPDGRVVGIDTNRTSIAAATELARDRKIANIDFAYGDALNLSDFADQSFDAVHAHQVVLHIPDHVKALKEMRRVLKKDGVLAIRDNVSMFYYPPHEIFEKTHGWFRDMSRSIGAEPQGGLYSHDWMQQAGFSVDKMQASSVTGEYATPEARGAWAAGMGTGFKTVALKTGYGTDEDFEEHARVTKAWVDNEMGRLVMVDGTVVAWK